MSDRTDEQVWQAASTAGMTAAGSHGPVQLLRFTSDLGTHDLRLLELHPAVEKSMKSGERLVIRGDAGDEAVLCTESGTFELKLVDTSNVLLLCPGLSTPGDGDFKSTKERVIRHEVCASVSSYYEVRPCRARLFRLKELLQSAAYQGPGGMDTGLSSGGFMLDELLDLVQASEAELRDGLAKLDAWELEGRWHVFDLDYKEQCMLRILQSLDEKDWSYMAVPLEECCQLLEELVPEFVVRRCLECYSSGGADEAGCYCLDATKVCCFYGCYLLRQVEKFNFTEFMDVWQQSVPDGMTVDISMLQGLALHNRAHRPPIIWYFAADDLPFDATERFDRLFRQRAKWTLEDLSPYIRDLVMPNQTMEALLLKHARSSVDSTGCKLYNSRRTLS